MSQKFLLKSIQQAVEDLKCLRAKIRYQVTRKQADVEDFSL
jgi:hypothetical protein